MAQEYKGKCDWNDNWYASRKLDGVRCLAVTDFEGKCTLYSRMGKNRIQRKTKEKNKPKQDNIYSKKHVRISLMKQEKHFEKMSGNKKKFD